MTGWGRGVHVLDAVLVERSARLVGRQPLGDAAMAAVARHAAKLDVALLAALFVGGTGEAGRRRRTAALRTTLALVLTIGAIDLIGRVVRRTRPFALHEIDALLVNHAPHRSFPSRHAACAATMATVTLPTSRGFGWPMGALAALLSISRVYTGLHYPTDILGGWVIGVAVGLFARQVGRPRHAITEIA